MCFSIAWVFSQFYCLNLYNLARLLSLVLRTALVPLTIFVDIIIQFYIDILNFDKFFRIVTFRYFNKIRNPHLSRILAMLIGMSFSVFFFDKVKYSHVFWKALDFNPWNADIWPKSLGKNRWGTEVGPKARFTSFLFASSSHKTFITHFHRILFICWLLRLLSPNRPWDDSENERFSIDHAEFWRHNWQTFSFGGRN